METRDLATTFVVREDDTRDGIAAVIDGLAVPYGTEIAVGGIREEFAPGSFDPIDVIGRPLAWRHDEPIGRITHARNTDTGLHVTAEIADTSRGRDAAALARLGGMGLSVGFEPKSNAWTKTRDKVTRISASLRELSMTHMPAYATAGVSEIREEPTVDETTTPTVAEATAPAAREFVPVDDFVALQRQVAAIADLRPADTPPVMSDTDWLREYGVKRFQKRALDDLILDGAGSDIAVVPTSVSARVDFGRPTVAAIGTSPLGATGNDAVWLVQTTAPTVGKRATAEKTTIPSGNPVVQKVTAPVETFAGGLDVSLEWIARSAAYDYPYLIGQMAEQYARQVNIDVAKKITGAAANTIVLPDTGLTAEVLGQKLGWAASKIAVGTGRAPSMVILSADKFFQVATVAGYGYPLAGGASVGNANLSGLTFSAFGVRFICDPTLDTGLSAGQHGYVLDPMSVGIKENSGAPLTIEANNVELLGRDVALYGFVASAVLNAAGIVSVTDA